MDGLRSALSNLFARDAEGSEATVHTALAAEEAQLEALRAENKRLIEEHEAKILEIEDEWSAKVGRAPPPAHRVDAPWRRLPLPRAPP